MLSYFFLSLWDYEVIGVGRKRARRCFSKGFSLKDRVVLGRAVGY